MAPSFVEEATIIGNGEVKSTSFQANGIKTNRATGKEYENYTVSETPLGTPRSLRVITIGAGAAGLNMARHIELHMENVDHIIYEKNPEVGGTWYENK